MFLDYRNKLRLLWRGDTEARGSGVLAYLLGIIAPSDFVRIEYIPAAVGMHWFEREARATSHAYNSLLQSHPEREWRTHSMVCPVWGRLDFEYSPRGDFEAALWALIGESWRARLCGQCRRYFIADKPAQNYCSTRCYGEAKRGQKREWWRTVGRARRSRETIRTGPQTMRRTKKARRLLRKEEKL